MDDFEHLGWSKRSTCTDDCANSRDSQCKRWLWGFCPRRAWLLLAEIYIQSSKYDLASSLCHLAKAVCAWVGTANKTVVTMQNRLLQDNWSNFAWHFLFCEHLVSCSHFCLEQDHNRSCGKAGSFPALKLRKQHFSTKGWMWHFKLQAWEQLGLIYEKEQAYKDGQSHSILHRQDGRSSAALQTRQDAASHYEKAWEFCNEASPAVGSCPSWSSCVLGLAWLVGPCGGCSLV